MEICPGAQRGLGWSITRIQRDRQAASQLILVLTQPTECAAGAAEMRPTPGRMSFLGIFEAYVQTSSGRMVS